MIGRKPKPGGLAVGTAVVLLCLYAAFCLANSLLPLPQFTVDLAGLDQGLVTIYTYHNQGTAFPMETEDGVHFVCRVGADFLPQSYDIRLTAAPEEGGIVSAQVNGKPLGGREVVRMRDVSDLDLYARMVVLRPFGLSLRFTLLFAGLTLLLLFLCGLAWREVKKSGRGWTVACYSGSALAAVGRKPILLCAVAAVLTMFLSVGSDINVILSCVNLNTVGVDLYQLGAVCHQRLQIELIPWPYNLPMLMFYTVTALPGALGLPFFQPLAYHAGYYLLYKLIHCGLLLLTVLSILSFLLDHGIIQKKACRSAFLWAVFNPVSFYIAVIYLQLDVFPVCCITLGTLLLVDRQCPTLAGLLLAVGVSCKQQTLLLLPLILFLYFFLLVKELPGAEDRLRRALKTCLPFLTGLFLFLLPNLIKGLPLNLMAQYTPQSERVWWTTIQYAPAVFLFLAPSLLLLAVLCNLFRISSKLDPVRVGLNALYMYGVVVLLFSFSILSTPSTLLHGIAAFTLCFACSKDTMQRFVISLFSILMVFEVMFTSTGDILALLGRFDFPYTFTAIERALAGTPRGTRWFSLLFTISHAAMLAYSLLFYRKAAGALEGRE